MDQQVESVITQQIARDNESTDRAARLAHELSQEPFARDCASGTMVSYDLIPLRNHDSNIVMRVVRADLVRDF
ncbi:MAG: hypothetical protein AAB384_04190 [Patescibacteria group bacterium]